MTTPAGIAPRTVVPGQVVTPAVPTAVIDPKSAAVHGLAAVLTRLVHYSGAYHTEADVLAALDAIRAFENAQVSRTVRDTLHEMLPLPAPVEDVSLRTPPGNVAPQPLVAHGIDYAKLAAALVAAQRAQQEEVADA